MTIKYPSTEPVDGVFVLRDGAEWDPVVAADLLCAGYDGDGWYFWENPAVGHLAGPFATKEEAEELRKRCWEEDAPV